MLLWTCVYKYLSESLISIILDICPEVELLDNIVIPLLLFLRNNYTVFHGSCTIYIPTAVHKNSNFSPSSPTHSFLGFCFLFVIAILMGVNWFLVVFICIFLIVNEVELLIFMCWLSVYHLFKKKKKFNGCTCSIWKFLGQGLNPSCTCNLCRSCDNAGSFKPLCQARDQTHTSAVTTAVGFLTHCAAAGTPYIIFEEMSIQILCPSFNRIVWFFGVIDEF